MLAMRARGITVYGDDDDGGVDDDGVDDNVDGVYDVCGLCMYV